MIIILIALYSVIIKFSTGTELQKLNDYIYLASMKLGSLSDIKTKFLYLNLAKTDPYFILAALSGLLQLVASKMTIPYNAIGKEAAKSTPDKKDDLAYNVQSQMLYTMTIMNFIIGIKLPSGVVLYLVITTMFSIVQTYFVSGWGGLRPWIDKLVWWKK